MRLLLALAADRARASLLPRRSGGRSSRAGQTICSDGSPYRFFVHPGDPAKLLVEFEGGGGCWDDATCATSIYSRRITIDPVLAEQSGLLVGLYDRKNPENPFRDWTHVYVPYCTGDLHWGNNDKTYSGPSGPYVVRHRGAVNAAAAVLVGLRERARPAPAVRGRVQRGRLRLRPVVGAPDEPLQRSLGRAVLRLRGGGGAARASSATPLANWGASAAWPSFIPSLALDRIDTSRVTLTDFYDGVAGHYPLSAFSQFNRLADTTQVFFYILTKGGLATTEEWAAQM